jgi:two-component system sensor histidine kinase KdpD
VENLLNISRLESGHIQPKKDWTDVVELIYDVVKRVEENNPHRKIDISINQNLPLCSLDKGMLDQVIYNLVNNAAIHTEANKEILVSATCPADVLEVIVEDSGQGFNLKEINDVFYKFSRARNSATAGSGLGLSIVKGFTEALSGTVSLEKSEMGGARFIILIPVKTNSFNYIHE